MRMSNNNQTALTNVEIFTDIVKSFYRTAQVYEELTNSDENS